MVLSDITMVNKLACVAIETLMSIKLLNKPNYLLTSYFYRSVDCWNSLPLIVKNSTSLQTFKAKLLTVDLSLYLIGSAFV
jgi:hypothetical protein